MSNTLPNSLPPCLILGTFLQEYEKAEIEFQERICYN